MKESEATWPAPNKLYNWAKRKGICRKCGHVVAEPKEINGQLRGHCRNCGRVDAEWVDR